MYYLKKFDGPKSNSLLFGNISVLLGSQDEIYTRMAQLARKYYPHYRLSNFLMGIIVILRPEDLELFLGSRKHTKKSMLFYRVLLNWLKDGLVMSKGGKWFQRRKVLTPAFHFSILSDFVQVFNENTEKFLETISTDISESINVFPLIHSLTLSIINETAMGTKLDMKYSSYQKYLDAIHELEGIMLNRLLRAWLHPTCIYSITQSCRREKSLLKTLHAFTRRIIEERFATYKPNKSCPEVTDENGIYMNRKKGGMALLDILLQAHHSGNLIDYEGICEEVDTFMFAGHDTVSGALSCCMMLIANHPDIQEQVYNEIISVCGNEQKPTYSDLQRLELLERVIKESLRLYPSGSLIAREAEEDTELRSGLIVPKNMTLVIDISSVHRNPEIYPDPERFDPDRFLPDNCKNRHPFAYIPFSAGPRNCIGQKFAILEMKSILVGCIRKFYLIAVDTPASTVIETRLVLRPKNGIRIKFETRI